MVSNYTKVILDDTYSVRSIVITCCSIGYNSQANTVIFSVFHVKLNYVQRSKFAFDILIFIRIEKSFLTFPTTGNLPFYPEARLGLCNRSMLSRLFQHIITVFPSIFGF